MELLEKDKFNIENIEGNNIKVIIIFILKYVFINIKDSIKGFCCTFRKKDLVIQF